jgi:hypothetical protein
MDILAASREVGSYRGAAAMCGTTRKTVRQVVERHNAGGSARRAAHGAALALGVQLRPVRAAGPMIIEAGAASVITVTARSPFAETERSARRWLPYLRLLAAIALTGLAILALQLGAVGENLNDGIAVLAWNVIGFTGLGLPCPLITVARSPGRSPRDNTTFCRYALLEAWTAPVDLAGRSARRSRRLDLRVPGLRGRPAAVHRTWPRARLSDDS